jgi:hypothetical protein
MKFHHKTFFSVFFRSSGGKNFFILCLRVEKFNLFLFPYLFLGESEKNWIIFEWFCCVEIKFEKRQKFTI